MRSRKRKRTHFSQTQLRPGRSCSGRHSCNDSGKNQKRNAIANPALGNLLTQPHEKSRPGGQGQHRHQPEPPTTKRHHRCSTNLHVFQTNRYTQALYQAQYHCAVTGILVDLLPALFTLFFQPFQVRNNNGKQFKNNGRTDVWHDAEGEHRHLLQGTTRKHVEETQNGALHAFEIAGQGLTIDSGRRDKGANSIDCQQAEGVENPLSQFWNLEYILNPVNHDGPSSTFPPAPTIFCLAA